MTSQHARRNAASRPVANTGERDAGARRGRGRTLRRIALIGVATILVVGVVALGAISWVGAERAIHQPAKTWQWQLADFPALRAEPVTIPSSTGITLAGRFFPGASRATIVVSHGYGNAQDEVLPWADFLVRAGYSVLTYDMRARGDSGGDAITLGALEQDDLVSVIDYLAGRPDVDPDRIGALGVSLGGVTSILAAGKDPRIKAVIAGCPFSDAPAAIGTAFEANIGLPAFPFGPLSTRIAEWRTGQRMTTVRATDAASQIAPRPLLLIHGTADADVPPANSERILAAAGEPKELVLVPGATHGMPIWSVDKAAFERRVLDFFARALAP